jgi:hypothetical protein
VCQYHGHKVFKALITGTNERGEIWVQFLVVTDWHDQFKRSIAELLKILTAYGHMHPYLFSTDQPGMDHIFFKLEIPSLQAKQDELGRLVFAPVVVPAAAELEAGAFTLLKTPAAINTVVADITHDMANKST